VIIGIDASRATRAHPTGTERYAREIIRAVLQLAPQHHYRLYLRDPVDEAAHTAFTGRSVELVHIAQQRLWTHVGLAREIEQRPPDVLFIPSHVMPFRHAFRKPAPVVVGVHDLGYRLFPDTHPFKQRVYLDLTTGFAARFADGLAAVSEATRQDLIRLYHANAAKIVVTHEGVLALPPVSEPECAQVRQKFDLPMQQPFFLHVGTLQPRKNLRRLLMAFAQLRNSWKLSGPVNTARFTLHDPLLVLAGAPGWGREDLPAVAESLGIQNSMRFTGYISDVEKSALMHSAFAYVFPSLYEGFGLPVLEAQSSGTAVLCSQTSSLPEVAGAGALWFNPLDEQSIAAALQRILLDPALRADLIRHGTENTKRFSWSHSAQQVLVQLEQVAQEWRK